MPNYKTLDPKREGVRTVFNSLPSVVHGIGYVSSEHARPSTSSAGFGKKNLKKSGTHGFGINTNVKVSPF